MGVRVILYPRNGDPPIKVHRVDVREILAYGEHTLDPPDGGADPDVGLIPGLSVPAVKVLREKGIKTMGQLRAKGLAEVESLEGFPSAALTVLRAWFGDEQPRGEVEEHREARGMWHHGLTGEEAPGSGVQETSAPRRGRPRKS